MSSNTAKLYKTNIYLGIASHRGVCDACSEPSEGISHERLGVPRLQGQYL